MSDRESDFLKALRQTLAIALGTTLVALSGLVLTFYFTTKYKVEEHDVRIQAIEDTKVERIEYDAHITTQSVIDNQIIKTLDEIKADIKDLKKNTHR